MRRYETLPPLLARDPAVLLVLHNTVKIAHVCPPAFGINRDSSLYLLLSCATCLLTLPSWKPGPLNWAIMQGWVVKPLRRLPLSHGSEEGASPFLQPAAYMSLIFGSSGSHTVTSLPDVKEGMKIERRKAARIRQFPICLF